MDDMMPLTPDTYWRLDVDDNRMFQLLDCPTYGEHSPAVDAAWTDYLGRKRQFAAFHLTLAHRDGVEKPADYQTLQDEWEHWNRPSEIIRADHAHEAVTALARHKDGLADKRVGRLGTSTSFNASDLMDAPRVIAVLDGRMHPDDMLDLDHEALYQSIQRNRTADELLGFAARVYEAHVDLVGRETFDMLLARQMEDERRIKLFQFCKTQQAMDLLTENEHGYPLFDAVIVAASLVRWSRFWASHKIGIVVPSMPILPA